MPTPSGEAREDEIVELVTSALAARGGVVELLDRPDRNPERSDGLTVDLELLIDDVKWAIDVIALRWGSGLEGAVRKIKVTLELKVANRIDPDQTLILYCHASRDAKVISSLVALASTAVETSTDQWRGDEAALLRERVDGLGAVEVCPWLSSTADLAEEVSSSTGLAVRKKLEGQFDRARSLGYRAALVMDQRGAEDLTFGANFLPSPSTILSVVEEIEREAAAAFDGLLLIDAQNDLQLLRW